MKRKLIVSFVLASLVLLVSGCSTWRKLDNTEQGAVIGGGTGALIGGAVAPGVVGPMVGGAAGAVTGGVIGHEIQKDKQRRRN